MNFSAEKDGLSVKTGSAVGKKGHVFQVGPLLCAVRLHLVGAVCSLQSSRVAARFLMAVLLLVAVLHVSDPALLRSVSFSFPPICSGLGFVRVERSLQGT